MISDNLDTMLDINGMGYLESYKCLMLKHKELTEALNSRFSAFFFPAPTILPFSIELLIKSEIEKQNERKNQDKNTRGHKLHKLFGKLDGKTQGRIIDKTIEFSKIKTRIVGKGESIKKDNFLRLLKLNGDRFSEIRYFHERDAIKNYNVDFLEALMFAISSSKEDYVFFLRKMLDNESQTKRKSEIKNNIFLYIVSKRSKQCIDDSKESLLDIGAIALEDLEILDNYCLYDLMRFQIRVLEKEKFLYEDLIEIDEYIMNNCV